MDVHFLSELRRALAGARQGLAIQYISETAIGQIEGLLDGTYQAGIGTLPIDNEALKAVCLFQEPMFTVLQKGHRLARKRFVQVSDLGDDPVIWMPREVNPALHDHFLQWCRKQGYLPNVVQYVTTVSETLDFVAEGVGVGFAKTSAKKLHADGLVFRPLGKPPFYKRRSNNRPRSAA